MCTTKRISAPQQWQQDMKAAGCTAEQIAQYADAVERKSSARGEGSFMTNAQVVLLKVQGGCTAEEIASFLTGDLPEYKTGREGWE
jgi:hypothetical protein